MTPKQAIIPLVPQAQVRKGASYVGKKSGWGAGVPGFPRAGQALSHCWSRSPEQLSCFCTALIESLNQKPQPAGDQPQATEATHATHRKAAGANAPSANGEAGGGESTKGYTAEQVAAVKR